MKYKYTVHFEFDEEDNVYIVTVPALKGCHSYGHTMEEAESNIKEAILCSLEGLQIVGEEIPIEEAPYEAVEKPIEVNLAAVV